MTEPCFMKNDFLEGISREYVMFILEIGDFKGKDGVPNDQQKR